VPAATVGVKQAPGQGRHQQSIGSRARANTRKHWCRASVQRRSHARTTADAGNLAAAPKERRRADRDAQRGLFLDRGELGLRVGVREPFGPQTRKVVAIRRPEALLYGPPIVIANRGRGAAQLLSDVGTLVLLAAHEQDSKRRLAAEKVRDGEAPPEDAYLGKRARAAPALSPRRELPSARRRLGLHQVRRDPGSTCVLRLGLASCAKCANVVCFFSRRTGLRFSGGRNLEPEPLGRATALEIVLVLPALSRFGGNATRSLDVAPLIYVARCGAHEAFVECLSGRLNSKLIRASDASA
jgi:hypothetical protein